MVSGLCPGLLPLVGRTDMPWPPVLLELAHLGLLPFFPAFLGTCLSARFHCSILQGHLPAELLQVKGGLNWQPLRASEGPQHLLILGSRNSACWDLEGGDGAAGVPGALPFAADLRPPLGSGGPIRWQGCQGGWRGWGRCGLHFCSQPPAPLCSCPSSPDPHCAALSTWPWRGMEGMGFGPRRALPLTYAPPLPYFPQRPGMSPGSRMPMAGLQVGLPAGSPFGAAAPLRPGMPPTMMDPFRKRLLVPQAQPPMPAQRRG